MMAAAFQQQIFALDARFNAYRAPNNPNFKTLYIRRRSQLLRENAKFKDIETIRKYINIRSQLLQRRYGVQDNLSLGSGGSIAKVNLADDPAARRRDVSISENYAFSGVHHIFDHHRDQVSMVRFANNDRSKLCCVSHDGTVSICDVTAVPPTVTMLPGGHSAAVTGCDWSASNELLVTCGLDARLTVWAVSIASNELKDTSKSRKDCSEVGKDGSEVGKDMGSALAVRRVRTVADQLAAPMLCCCFQPSNNNMVIAGNERGMVQVLNISTGIYPKGGSSILGGRVTAIACDSSGRIFWAANDKGYIVSYLVTNGGSSLSKLRRCVLGGGGAPVGGGAVTSLAWSPWLARHPALLANVTDNSLYLFRVTDREGSLQLRQRFPNQHRALTVRASFCPIMSLRRGVCVVSGAEDCCVHFLHVDGHHGHPALNKLQGHAHPVLGVSFSYDESLLATSDSSGLVIIWRRS